MKKVIFLFIILFMSCRVSAQTLDSIANLGYGYYGPNQGSQMDGIAQLSDGNVLFVQKIGINMGTTSDVVGNLLYRVSKNGCILLDTLFIEDSDPSFYLFAKNPNGEGNIRVGIVHDTVNRDSYLQIFPFDDELNYDTVNEVFVHLSDTIVFSPWKGYVITEQNDLAFNYYSLDDEGKPNMHFACFGLDGTLKHESTLPYSSFPLSGHLGFGIFNESPLEYYLYCYPKSPGSRKVACCILDSLLQYKDSFTLTEGSGMPLFKYIFGWSECILPDGDDFIFASRYEQGVKDGVCLVRYDKQTLEKKNTVFFESRPMIPAGTMQYGACPTGLGKDSEGSICFAYQTQCPLVTDKGQVAVVKMDADFNVKWQRFCLEPEGFHRFADLFTVLDDGGIAVGGDYWGRPEVFFLIVHDDSWDVPEKEKQGFIVRPYAYYPNPAQDELHLYFSPDVTPKQIELYDLQGHFVRTQRNGLESLNLKGLSAGTYTLRVTLEGGKVFSDKVVKE
ncbi:MAG: T9SS type A sorting domain-containing protein [Bacteroidales bacterium]|nr:T9SS type A sorting domain-containing protein [Bacteroidales bacterium]